MLAPLGHWYWYGNVPPLAVTVAVPFVCPKQETGVVLAMVAEGMGAALTWTGSLAVQIPPVVTLRV